MPSPGHPCLRSRLVRSLIVAPVVGVSVLAPTGAATLLSSTRATVSHVLALAPAVSGRTPLTTAVSKLLATGRDLGSAPGGDRFSALVGLRLPNEAALKSFVANVSNPADAAYGHYLSPEEFRARYAPSTASADAVAGWLRSSGLHVVDVPSNHLYVAVTGTVAQAEKAFATKIDKVSIGGHTVEAAVRTASAPRALAGVVGAIRGLDGSDAAQPQSVLAPPAIVNAQPCSQYWGQVRAAAPMEPGFKSAAPATPCGYVPAQLQAVYGVAPAIAHGIDGTGVKVAIIDAWASPRMATDLQTYSAKHGLPPAKIEEFSNVLASDLPGLAGTPIDPDGWVAEETVDTEAVHAMAPGATIVYDASTSPYNFMMQMAQNDVVNNKRAQIVSNSYGSPNDAADPTTDSIFMQAAAEGMGFYFASGDGGDESKDPNGPGDRETNSPANSPYVTSVGGTSLGVGAGGKYLFETYWGESTSTLTSSGWGPSTWLYGGGGGTSQAYAQPDYQKGVVPASIADYWQGKPPESGTSTSTPLVPGRAEPDISMLGDPNTGMLIGFTQDFSAPKNPQGLQLPIDDVHYGEYRIGGTSLSSPLFAGVMALADQAAGKPHGFLNPALYAAYRHNPGIVRDPHNPTGATLGDVRVNYNNKVDSGSGTTTILRQFDQLLTLHELRGYDDSTGLGTPYGIPFLAALAPGSATLAHLLPR